MKNRIHLMLSTALALAFAVSVSASPAYHVSGLNDSGAKKAIAHQASNDGKMQVADIGEKKFNKATQDSSSGFNARDLDGAGADDYQATFDTPTSGVSARDLDGAGPSDQASADFGVNNLNNGTNQATKNQIANGKTAGGIGNLAIHNNTATTPATKEVTIS